MKRYPQIEIDHRIKKLYNSLIAGDSLINAKQIADGVHKLCKAEVKRRKQLEGL